MMVSLEVRAPFLDNDLVEFARRLPHRYKYRNGQTKYLLKKALEPVLPKDILYRSKKGFGVPLTSWLRNWSHRGTTHDPLGLDEAWVERQWRDHASGGADNRMFLWDWLVLQSHIAAASA